MNKQELCDGLSVMVKQIINCEKEISQLNTSITFFLNRRNEAEEQIYSLEKKIDDFLKRYENVVSNLNYNSKINKLL